MLVAAADQPVLVDPEVSRRKLQREIDWWRANAASYRRRGWIMVDHHDLAVELALAAPVQLSSGPRPLPVLSACFRLDYSNYDLWPPSLRFIDLFTGEPSPPHVRGMFVENGQLLDALLDEHPATGLPFFCIPGLREYHEHPQHSGDDWLLHRDSGAGNLATICDRVWRYMVRNVVGMRVTLQTCPPPVPAQFDIRLAQGDIDGLLNQVTGIPLATAPT